MIFRLCLFFAVAVAFSLDRSASAEEATQSIEEFPAEQAALVAATTAFFDGVEARALSEQKDDLIGLPLSIIRSAAPSSQEDILTRMGPVRQLTGYRITWYPLDRLYGTVDFIGTWRGQSNLVCGYLTWDLSDPETPVLETVSASFVDIAALRRGTAQQIGTSLLEANCAHGTVEKNFKLFDVTG